ncbi:hypothetical protein EXIGLDRAFT_722199 [Exidia glandulosa HHB12029]|uniref:Uncharacterized protein n=1 Tax=Exidia glandulosa HHB12029 TaxID=1314781 RepID=A0A165FDN6_EXIGL|nr:hypothetical protein EXIGLDRAFT_722199 [Exidia glandulosa HHB12029]
MQMQWTPATSSTLPQLARPFGEHPSPLISHRAVPMLFETVTALTTAIEPIPRAGGSIYVLYASTRVQDVSIYIHDSCMHLDVVARQSLHKAETLPWVPAHRLISIVDAVVRANQHRTSRTNISDDNWICEVIKVLMARGYIATSTVETHPYQTVRRAILSSATS